MDGRQRSVDGTGDTAWANEGWGIIKSVNELPWGSPPEAILEGSWLSEDQRYNTLVLYLYARGRECVCGQSDRPRWMALLHCCSWALETSCWVIHSSGLGVHDAGRCRCTAERSAVQLQRIT